MEYKVNNKAIAVAETLFDGFDERPVDCDFVLPDYYPDIAAVLKCTLKPVIQTRQLSGDRLTADGAAVVQVLYLDEARRCVHSCEFTKPFSSSFAVKPAASPAVKLDAKTEYVNCRAVSPRRLDIHGAFSIRLNMQAEGGTEVVSSVSGPTVFTKRSVVSYSVPAVSAEKSFTLSEVLELGADQPPAEVLVRGDAVPILTDCKLLTNKAIVKGDLKLSNLYVSDMDTGEVHKVYHEIPFSQIIDMDGLDEEWQCDVRLSVASSDVRVEANQNGEGRLLEVSVKLNAAVQSYRTGMAEIVTDAYSTACPLKLESRPLETSHLQAVRHATSTVRDSLELPPDGVASVLDIWSDAALTGERCEGGRSLLDARLTLYMLTRDAAGVVSFYERPLDIKLEYDDDCTDVSSDLAVSRLDYTLTGGGRVELRADLDVTRRCFSTHSMTAVSAVTADESAPFSTGATALKVYFARSGESLWEVAKACHTSMDAVMEENTLNGDVLTKDTLLLVPLC